jgi:L-alanine-DL-glutamate epimerase-like enolase superfamily enzyme
VFKFPIQVVQYARTLAMLARRNWPRCLLFPHGGNQMSLAIAAGFGLGLRGILSRRVRRLRRLRRRCRIENGYMTLSDRPGIGFEGQGALYRIMRELADL